jgi:hypothetical protein
MPVMTQEELSKLMDGIQGAKPATLIDPTDKLTLAIMGPPKAGKSWFAATIAEAVGATYFFDCDNRKESIAGKPNVIVKTYTDLSQIRPTAMKALEADMERFKYNKTSGKAIPAAYVLDSMSFLKKIMENELFEQGRTGKVKLAREVKTGGDTVLIPEGWDIVNGVREYMLYLIAELRSLGHVIAIFHERPIVDKTLSTAERTVYTGEVGVDPPFMHQLLSVFNEVMRIKVDANSQFKVWTRATKDFNGATTLKGLELIENPSIAAMLDKHHKFITANKV